MFERRIDQRDMEEIKRYLDEVVERKVKAVAYSYLFDFFKEGLQPLGDLNQLSTWAGLSSFPNFPTDKSIIESLLNKAIDAGIGARIAKDVEGEARRQINSEAFIDGVVDRINRKQVRGGCE